jgi:hypothetical protein
MGTFTSISGGESRFVHIYGNGTVHAGTGNDSIRIDGNGTIEVGSGKDHLTLEGSGKIVEHASLNHHGHDTINLGSGNDTILEAGRATVHGAFGHATVQGGKFEFYDHHGHGQVDEIARSGKATMVGGSHDTKFVVAGTAQATMIGGSGNNLFEITGHKHTGTDVIKNFVHGHDKLYLEGHSLSYYQAHGDVKVSHGSTFITLDGGKTTVELKGFVGLTSSDVTQHKG